jgi:polyhydroxyalkanoate synthesis repressor PhaR
MSQPARPEAAEAPAPTAPVVVKKYANRRLYNTESSSYITLDNLAQMIRAGRDFVVYDAKTGEDITRSVLTQIIVEEESKGRALLPTGFLRQLIGFYGDSLQTLIPRYLEQAMSVFARQQEQMRLAMQQSMGGFFPFNMEEVGRQNLAIMERAMHLFAPFYRPPGSAEPASTQAEKAGTAEEIVALQAEIAALRDQLAAAQRGAGNSRPSAKVEAVSKPSAEAKPADQKGGGAGPT